MLELFRRISIPHFAEHKLRTALALVGMALSVATSGLAAIAGSASPVTAVQQSRAEDVEGLAYTFREIDTDSGRELRRFTSWETRENGAWVAWQVSSYAGGGRTLQKCVMGDSARGVPTVRSSVTLSRAGQIERSDFDIFDPNNYPFLRRPLPSSPLEPVDCLYGKRDWDNRNPAEERSLWLWINDALYLRTVTSVEAREQITVPAGVFGSYRIRSRPDMATLIPNMPVWIARLFEVFAPKVRLWLLDHPPYNLLKLEGVGEPGHPHCAQELVSTARIVPPSAADAEILGQIAQAPNDPQLTLLNSGHFTAGEVHGTVFMSAGLSVSAGADGTPVVTRITTDDELSIEARAVVGDSSSPRTRYMEQRTYTRGGQLVQRKFLRFRAEAFPFGIGSAEAREIPSEVYPASLAMGLVLPRIRPRDDSTVTFHVLGFDGALSELQLWSTGVVQREPGNASISELQLKMRPVLDLPLFLKPLRRFLTPTFDLYLDDAPPNRLLDLAGPVGPPGAPEIHFIADREIPATTKTARSYAPTRGGVAK